MHSARHSLVRLAQAVRCVHHQVGVALQARCVRDVHHCVLSRRIRFAQGDVARAEFSWDKEFVHGAGKRVFDLRRTRLGTGGPAAAAAKFCFRARPLGEIKSDVRRVLVLEIHFLVAQLLVKESVGLDGGIV